MLNKQWQTNVHGAACSDDVVNEDVKAADIYRGIQAQYVVETLSRSKTSKLCKSCKEHELNACRRGVCRKINVLVTSVCM